MTNQFVQDQSNPKDFSSSQVKTKKVIASGQSFLEPKLLVYAESDSTDDFGGISSDMLSGVGSDVYLFVSGTVGGKENNTQDSTVLFGGDVIVSGTLYAENQVIEVDALSTGSLEVVGSITHSDGINIGDTSDAGGYSDGLFSDFTGNTLLSTVINKFNEVLKELAPSPPEPLKIAVPSDNLNSFDAFLSFGASNDLSSLGYNSVLSNGFPASDVAELYAEVDPLNDNYKLGCFLKDTIITADLNGNIPGETYENGTVNFPENCFLNADEGTLELYLNDVLIHSVDLSTIGIGPVGAGTDESTNVNDSGFFAMSAVEFTHFQNGQTFDTFKYKSGKYKINPADQVNGWNNAYVKHVINGEERTTGYIQWVNDGDGEDIIVTNPTVNLTLSGLKELSGIKYHTGGQATYSADVDNYYKFLYDVNPIQITSSSSILQFDDFAIQHIDPATEDHTKQINISKNSAIILPSSNRVLNDTGVVTFDVSHPYKTLQVDTTKGTFEGILIDNNVSQTSTQTQENFDDEEFRLVFKNSPGYSSQSIINDALNKWDSSQKLYSINTPEYNNGLVVYGGKLISPFDNNIANNGNLESLDNSHSNNADYSQASGLVSNGVKTYIRKFKNTTQESKNLISYQISGVGNLKDYNQDLSTNTDKNDFKIQFKVPGKTAWLDPYTDFVYDNTAQDGSGSKVGSFTSSISSNPTNYITLGSNFIDNNEDILLKIEAYSDWIGEVESFSVNFDALGNVSAPPAVSNVSTSNSGVSGKLSFGSSLPKDQDFEYVTTGNVTFSAHPSTGHNNFIEYTKHNIYISDTNIDGNFVLSPDLSDVYFSLSTTTLSNSPNPIGIFASSNTILYEVTDPNDLSTKSESELQNQYSNHGIYLEENKNYYFWRESDNNWYFSESSFPGSSGASSESYANVTGINSSDEVDVNEVYTISSVNNSSRRGIFNGNTVISAIINDNVSGLGTNNYNYSNDAWGAGQANVGDLKLEINGSIFKTLSLTDLNTSGDDLENNTGFKNITVAEVSKDNNGLPDYQYFYRRGSIQIDPAHQREGWNYARVLHDRGNSNIDETNYIEWVNSSTSGPVFESHISADLFSSISESSSTTSQSLSGITYFHTPVGVLTQNVKDVYKYVYDSTNSAVSYNTQNVVINSITLSGDGITNNTVNSSSRSLPNLDSNVEKAHDKDIVVQTNFTYTSSESLPGSLTSSSVLCEIKHPISDGQSSNVTLPKPLIYRINDTETATVEDFSAESYRLQSLDYLNQTEINLGTWDSTKSLIGSDAGHNDGLQIFDSKLEYPETDFSDDNDPSILFKGPVNNPDYSAASGERLFYRKFQNTTASSLKGCKIQIKGQNTSISSNTYDSSSSSYSLSTNEIKVFAKIPGQTGFLDISIPWASGQYTDGAGSLSGDLSSTILNTNTSVTEDGVTRTIQGTENEITFGVKEVLSNEFIIIKIVADDTWSGNLNRIEIVWS